MYMMKDSEIMSNSQMTKHLIDIYNGKSTVKAPLSRKVHKQIGGTCFANGVPTFMKANEVKAPFRAQTDHE